MPATVCGTARGRSTTAWTRPRPRNVPRASSQASGTPNTVAMAAVTAAACKLSSVASRIAAVAAACRRLVWR